MVNFIHRYHHFSQHLFSVRSTNCNQPTTLSYPTSCSCAWLCTRLLSLAMHPASFSCRDCIVLHVIGIVCLPLACFFVVHFSMFGFLALSHIDCSLFFPNIQQGSRHFFIKIICNMRNSRVKRRRLE